MIDQLVVLGTQERQLRQAAVRVEDAQLGLLVPDERRAIFATLDVNTGQVASSLATWSTNASARATRRSRR